MNQSIVSIYPVLLITLALYLIIPFEVFATCINPTSVKLHENMEQYWEISDTDQTGLDIVSDMTVSMWIKLESGSEKELLSKWDHVTQTSYLLTTTGTNLQLYLNSSPSGFGYRSVFAAHGKELGEWFHMTVVYDAAAAAAEFFVDGVSIGGGDGLPTSIADSEAPFRIGAYATPNAYFNGNVDEVKVWSRSLSHVEVFDLFLNPVEFNNGTNLEAYWRFDNNGNDSSPNNNNLTGINNIAFDSDVAFGQCESREGLYTQIESPYPSEEETALWAGDEYANGRGQLGNYPCGLTIGQCGCSITSLVMLGRQNGVTNGVDGEDLNPENLNDWLENNNGYDSLGNVFWSRAADYFGTEEDDKIVTPLKVESHKVYDINEIKQFVIDTDTSVIGHSAAKGHFFYLSEVLGDGFEVFDPLWYDTVTTNDEQDIDNNIQDYNDVVSRGVVYRFDTLESQGGVIEATLNGPAELLLVDADGRKSGYVEGEGVVDEIDSSGYVQDNFLTSSEDDISDPDYTKHLLATDVFGLHNLYVIGTDTGDYILSLFFKDESGASHYVEHVGETEEGQMDEVMIDLVAGTVNMPDDNEVSDRETFIKMVEEAVASERWFVKRSLLRHANRIFDSIERDRDRLALIRLRLFERRLEWRGIEDEELQGAIDRIRTDLR